jgi:Ca2+-binding EF-hand superfamily protein
MDADDDGMLSFDEMQAKQQKRLDKMFSRLDANEDGMLSAEELEKMKRKGKRHGEKHDHKDDDHN